MINRRSFITTASAFMAATHLPAMPVLADDVLSIEGRRLFIDEPILVNMSDFRSFKIDRCMLVFRGNGAIVVSNNEKTLMNFVASPDREPFHAWGFMDFSGVSGKDIYVTNCLIVDERKTMHTKFAPAETDPRLQAYADDYEKQWNEHLARIGGLKTIGV